jgi:hypothetical protein
MQQQSDMTNISLMTEHGKGKLSGPAFIWILILCLAIATAVLAIWAGKQPDYSDLSQGRRPLLTDTAGAAGHI